MDVDRIKMEKGFEGTRRRPQGRTCGGRMAISTGGRRKDGKGVRREGERGRKGTMKRT